VSSDPRRPRHPLATLGDAGLPTSVGLELARARTVLDATLDSGATDTLTASLVTLRMQGADATLLGAIVQRLAMLAPRLSGPGGLTAWLTAVQEVAEHARPYTLALLASSEEVLRHGSPAELLMWARLGLRQGQVGTEADEAGHDARLAHFELRSRESARALSPGGDGSDLATSKARLAYLLRALFDIAPALLPIEHGLASRRPFLSNLGLHLPEAGRALRGNAARRWYDAAAAHAAAHLRHSSHTFERGDLKPIQMALVGVLEDARIEGIACAELPGLRGLWLPFHVAEPAHGTSFNVLMLRLARGLLDPAYADPHPWVVKARRLIAEATEGGRVALMPAPLRDIASRLGNDIGQMRLQFNHRDYVVEPAYRDDNSHLWQHPHDTPPELQSVADELPLPPQPDTDRVLDIDADDGSAAPRARDAPAGERCAEAPLARLQYPEWDRLVGDYRSAWCTVLEGRPARADPALLQAALAQHGALLQRLDKVLGAGRWCERVKLRAQWRGDDLDVDAAVRAAIERRSRHPPGEKVHQRFDRHERDVSVLVLLDSSTSTADPVASGGSVLDLARVAAMLTKLALNRVGDACAIDAFCSNGRHDLRYELALDFGESLGAGAIALLAGLRSRLSTRMGAALRHATARLAAQVQRRKLLLFITDGEPHDVDIHDRRYLVEDARRAVLEAGRRGIVVFCVTLDPAADSSVRHIFGASQYRVLDRIDSLTRVLPPMVLRLSR
jgi:nitric oxide reductase NorD protein